MIFGHVLRFPIAVCNCFRGFADCSEQVHDSRPRLVSDLNNFQGGREGKKERSMSGRIPEFGGIVLFQYSRLVEQVSFYMDLELVSFLPNIIVKHIC